MEMLPHIALGLGLISILCLMASPAVGMVAVFIVKPFIDASWDLPLLFNLRLTEVYSTLITIVLLVHMVLAKGDKSMTRMPLKGMWLAYSAYIVMFSMIIAYNDDLKSSANICFRYINGIVGFYFLQAFFRQGDRFKWFLWALILGGVFPMGLGAYQAATGVQWREAQVEGLVRTIGIWHDGVNMRVYAEQTILGLLLYSALYVKTSNVPLKAIAMAYMAISTVVMVRVYSKAAILTVALWVLCWTILRRRFVALAVLGIAGLLVTTYYASDLMDQIGILFHKELGFISGKVEGKVTFQGRWFGWVEMMERWERFPAMSKMFGSGQIAIGAHNDFLQMLFHGGIVGLVMYISLLIVVGVRIARNLLARADEMAVAALMAYLMWLIDAIGLVPSAYPSEQWLVWGIIGLSFRMRADEALQQPIREVMQDDAVQDSPTGEPALATTTVQRRFPLLSDRGGSSYPLRFRMVLFAISAMFGSLVLCGDAGAAGKTFAGKKIIFEEGVPVWTTKQGTDELLSRIKAAGFNAFAPIVWHGRGTTWPSKYAEWDYWLKGQPKENFDPLKYLIDRAHEMGIEVHPWLNLTLREGSFLPQFAPPGTPEGAFDVHMPEFRHLMANLIEEIVSRYDVDGINLDYVRAVGLCTSDFCKADYAARYGRNLLLDTVQFKLTRRVPTLLEYQESDVTAMVQEISTRIRALKPNIVISADVIPLIVGMDQGQNSIDWANKGLVDVLCRMAYYRDIDINLTNKIRGLLKNPDALTITISNVSTSDEMPIPDKYYSRDGVWFADTISMIIRNWPITGVGVYMYRWLSDDQIVAVKAGPFRLAPPADLKVK